LQKAQVRVLKATAAITVNRIARRLIAITAAI
jgi:hypothetical protein